MASISEINIPTVSFYWLDLAVNLSVSASTVVLIISRVKTVRSRSASKTISLCTARSTTSLPRKYNF